METIKREKIDYDALKNIEKNYPSSDEFLIAMGSLIEMSYRTDNTIEEFEKAMSVLEKTKSSDIFKKVIHFDNGMVDITGSSKALYHANKTELAYTKDLEEKSSLQGAFDKTADEIVDTVQSLVITNDTNIINFTDYASNIDKQIQSNIQDLPEDAKTIALDAIIAAGKQVANVGNRINKQIDQITKNVHTLNNKIENGVHIAGKNMDIAKQNVSKIILEANTSWNKHKIDIDAKQIEYIDETSQKYVRIATGILKTSEAFRSAIPALGAELDKKLIEKRYDTSSSNHRFVTAVFKESMLHPDKTNQELITSVKEEFNQKKEMELGSLKKAEKKGPGLFAKALSSICMSIHRAYEKDPHYIKLQDDAVRRTKTVIDNDEKVNKLKDDIQAKKDDLDEQKDDVCEQR